MMETKIIPAPIGYFIVYADFDEGDAWVGEAVVAFAIVEPKMDEGRYAAYAMPITLSVGTTQYGGEIYVQRPDGGIEQPEGSEWGSFDEFLKYVKHISDKLKAKAGKEQHDAH